MEQHANGSTTPAGINAQSGNSPADTSAGIANGPAPQQEKPAPSDVLRSSNGSVLIRVEETGRSAEDRYRLEDVVRVLLEFKGTSAVTLEVKTSGSVVTMDMPFATVDPCPELETRLSDLLGPENISLPVATG